MSDKLKKFITDHKEEFDTREPSKQVWAKIDEAMSGKKNGWIRSKQFSKYLYIGFGLSAIILGIYCVIKLNSKEISANEQVVNNDLLQKTNNEISSDQEQNTSVVANQKSKSGLKFTKPNGGVVDNETDTTNISGEANTKVPEAENENETPEITKTDVVAKEMTPLEKKRNELIKNRKKKDLYIPADPEKFNSYEGTVYESTSFCALLSAFKLYGDVQIDHGKWHQDGEHDKVTIRAVSCNYLANIPDMKAVWIKGKTDQKLKFSIDKGFQNVVLIKKDGSKTVPRAVSHYYPGIGAIGEFKGKFFNLVFTDKVELIFFFKNAEEGDKIIIDDKIEVFVKAQP